MLPQLLLGVILLGLPYIQAGDDDYCAPEYPINAPCNYTIVKYIEEHWKTAGKPKDVLKTMEKTARYVDYYTSIAMLDSTFKCVFLDVADSIFNFTSTHKNGSEPVKFSYQIKEESEGILLGRPYGTEDAPKYRWKWYVVYLDDGIQVDYICNDEAGEKSQPILGDIFVSSKSFYRPNTIQSSRKYQKLMKSWGFNFTFSSGYDCLLPETGYKLPGSSMGFPKLMDAI